MPPGCKASGRLVRDEATAGWAGLGWADCLAHQVGGRSPEALEAASPGESTALLTHGRRQPIEAERRLWQPRA